MKKIFFLLVFSILSIIAYSQVEKLQNSPIFIDDTLVVIGINSKTSDKELLEIRTKLLKFSTIRFIEFDVIREPSSKKNEQGDIQFLSLEVDCRDGYIGKISHSFEKGDNSIQGFYRDYSKNTYRRAFFIGKLADNYPNIENTKPKDVDFTIDTIENRSLIEKNIEKKEKNSIFHKIKNIFF